MLYFESIKDLFRAFHWADETLLTTIPDAYLDTEVKSSFPSIRKTYNHMWDANTAWYYRLTGVKDDPSVSKKFSGNDAEWRAAYLDTVKKFIDHLEGKDENYFTATLTYTNLKGDQYTQPIYEILQHIVNHATGHRGQGVTLLRNAGYEGKVPAIDFIHWFRAINKH